HAEGSRLTLLGPLVEWQRDERTTTFAVRPFFHTTRDREKHSTTGIALYPVASWQSTEESFFIRFLGLASYERRRAAEAPGHSEATERELSIFPLVDYRAGGAAGASLSVVPFYANLEHRLGYERIQMLLFPGFLRLVEPLYTRTWFPFPFLSTVGGRSGSGFRFWPFYGRTRVGAESDTLYVGWPFYIRHVDHPGHEGAVVQRVSWPFFASIEGPRLTSRSYAFLILLPLYTHTVDRREGTETSGFPWPFWIVQRDLATGRRRSLRLTPFYQDRETEFVHSKFVLWPFYRHKVGRAELAGYERTDSLFVFYRDQREPEGRGARRFRILVPLWSSSVGPDEAHAQAPTLLDGLFPKNENVAALYAPLWRLYGYRRRNERTHGEILWRMWEWGDGGIRAPWYLSWRG
ncbi:MAG: hypothetical protein QOD06_948, partial [Candidatus Binatota bacterium]|nr:hypothetical protein [Candidatus Binatota bacterium]